MRRGVSKALDTAMLTHLLPNAAPDDEPACLWVSASKDCKRSRMDASSKVSVQLHVPRHLHEYIGNEPVLMDFREASESECSWDMPSCREPTKSRPKSCSAPDRHDHEQHRKRLDDYLEKVSKKPRKFEAEVHLKKMLSGMRLVGLKRSQESKTR